MNQKHLKSTLRTRDLNVRVVLRHGLEQLKIRVERALSDLEAEEQIDEHLIVNASGLTADIAKWNLIRDLHPYVNQE